LTEVVLLGSGTSTGVPVLGFDYPASFLANPKNHRTRPSILIRGPHGNILVDATPDMRMQLLREDVRMIDATLITHTHADHIMGMDDLRSFCLRTKRDMPVYTLPRYADDIRRVFAYAFGEFPEGIEVPRFALNELHMSDSSSWFGMDLGPSSPCAPAASRTLPTSRQFHRPLGLSSRGSTR
jgi:phosphoribosyl 1,2-cyclic phosphate phosphodiesterase